MGHVTVSLLFVRSQTELQRAMICGWLYLEIKRHGSKYPVSIATPLLFDGKLLWSRTWCKTGGMAFGDCSFQISVKISCIVYLCLEVFVNLCQFCRPLNKYLIIITYTLLYFSTFNTGNLAVVDVDLQKVQQRQITNKIVIVKTTCARKFSPRLLLLPVAQKTKPWAYDRSC